MSAPNPERYQAFYCEENIWWLARRPELRNHRRWAVFVSNPNRTCAMWAQQAAPLGQAVVWDYHVVLFTQASNTSPLETWDLDSRLVIPCPAHTWLKESFRAKAPPALQPLFRVVPASALEAHFASDRRHMRTEAGGWRHPPPAWPCITARSGARHTLDAFVDVEGPGPGEPMDLPLLYAWALEQRP